MKTKSNSYFVAALVAAFIFVVAGCSGSSTSQKNQGAITAKLVWTGSKTSTKSVASAPSGVATVRLAISGSGMATIQQDFPAADGNGILNGVPAGSGMTVTASGLDASGAITHQGSVGNVTIQTGQTTDVGVITMQATNSLAAAAGTYNGTLYNLDGSINDRFVLIVDVAGNITGNNAVTSNDTTIAGKLTALSATQFKMIGSVMPGNYPMQGTLDSTNGNFTGGTVTGTNNFTWTASKSITPPLLVITSTMISGKTFQVDSGYTITFHTDGTVTTSKNSNINTWVLNADGTILLNYMDLTTNPPTPGWDKFTLIQDNSPVSLVISGLNISGTTYPNSTWAYYTPPVTPPSYSNSSFSSVWFTSQLGSGSPLYLISDGAGYLSDISAFNFATQPGSYSVNANGTYSMTLVQSNGSSFAFTGNLTSATAGTVSFSGSTGSLTKVADLAKCQGNYSGILSGGAAVLANYTISFSVGSTGTISSFVSNIPGATAITNSRFFSLADGTAIFMIRTNATSDEYRQIKGLGTLVNGRFTGTLELDSDAAGGTVTLTKQ